MKWVKWVLAIVVPGGAGLGFYWAMKKSEEVKAMTEDAVSSGGTFEARLTGYWPFTEGLTAAERKMEGGVNDRKGNPLHTLEDVQAGHAPFVSVSGDYSIFPYGQRITIDQWPGVVFRVVDTGSHFHGAEKVYRIAGREPLDICVASKNTVVPKLGTVTIIRGDVLDKKANPITDMNAKVDTTGFQGQTVTV